MKTITATIDKQGRVQIEANGFEGSSCEDATRAIEQALGAESSRERKPEFYNEQTNLETNQR